MKKCIVTPVSFSDHLAVSINIHSDDFIKRGPGFFKFNNSLLNDHCFVEELSKKIPEYKEKHSYLQDKRLHWDMLKMEIRSFTICYCKQIAKNRKNEEAVLQQQFSSLHKLMCANPEQERYYQNLYTSTCTHPNDTCFDEFLDFPGVSLLVRTA